MKFYDIFRPFECGWLLYDRVEAPSRRAAVKQVPGLLRGQCKVALAAQQKSLRTH